MSNKSFTYIVVVIALCSIVSGSVLREPCTVAEPQCPQIEGDEGELTILPVLTDCTKYILCHYGTPIVRPCPPGLVFSAQLSVCDFANRTTCNECEIAS